MILTARLKLRGWQQSDLSGLEAILGDAAVMEFSDHGPLDRSAQEDWLHKAEARGGEQGLPGTLAIESRTDGALIGYVSLSHDPKRLRAGDAELGFRIARSAWGQGYATEAAQGILQALSEVWRVVAIVDPHNARSVRVLAKLGMTCEEEIMFEGYDYPDHLYVLPRA